MAKDNNKRVTVYDIARVAKVSHSTVSKVLNNYPNLRDSTRKRVKDAIKELDYKPNLTARSLATNRSNTIGLIVEDISNPFYSESSKYIYNYSKDHNYNVIISEIDHNDINETIQYLLNQNVAGILIASIDNNYDISQHFNSPNPIIFYNQTTDSPNINYVKLDDAYGSKKAIDYLSSLGHKKISFISGPINRSTYLDRYNGYRNSLSENDLSFIETLVHIGDISYDVLKEKIISFFEEGHSPTSFFAASDAIALDIISILSEMNLNVPDDISVIGFGNTKLAAHILINLTTISQQVNEMSILAIKNLIDLIENPEKRRNKINVKLDPQLIIRGTTSQLID